ncbi:alpha/beta hydrolase family protein [Amycolatopsis sp. NPDC059027]|uniref:alpha/beta hydrolase family protein n=1 Tax=unclassified Amycolatopsis TaxID=2618356 RepID=UPI00366BFA53
MRRIALLATIVAFSALAPSAGAAEFTTTDVTFQNGGVTLHGTVVAPPGRRGLPGIVMVHGSGPGPRQDHRVEAEAFARGGVATLIYDKRTEGYSQFTRSYSTLADDALAAVQALRARPEVDPARVGVWGLSEGGWVAPLAASRSADVAFVVTVGANGVQPARQQAWAVENQLRHLGFSGSLVKMASSTMMRQLVGGGVFPEARYDPIPVLARLKQPVLGLWGARDVLTPPAEALRIFQETLSHNGNQHYTLRVFPDGQHQLRRTTDGFDKLDGYSPGYLELVSSWVNGLASGPPAASADAPPAQDRQSVELTPLRWYETTWLQLAVVLLLLIAFAAYPVGALFRRARAGSPSARWLSTTGLLATLGFFAVAMLIQLSQGKALGPAVLGRPLPWLALQLLAVAVVISTAGTAIAWWRHRTPRLGLLLAGGVVFIPWAIYWGLLVP